jgi:hypothetical protein
MARQGFLVDNVKRLIKPNGHFIKDRKTEILVGVLLFIVGSLLLYDAFDARGKKVPWPGGAIAPW